MSRRGKPPQINLRASRDLKPTPESKISISLRYLTKNKQHNFEFFSAKDFRQKAQAFEQFLDFLRRLTAKTQLEIISLSKTDDCGFEQILFQQINFKPDGTTLGQDAKIWVFRFGDNGNGGDYRLLGFFEDKQPVLSIIGFDFDYSAYKH